MRLSLRTRILSAFGISFVLFLGAMGYSIEQMRALGDDLELLNDGYLPLARLAAKVESYQDRIDLDVVRLRRDSQRPVAAFRSNTALHTTGITNVITQGRATVELAWRTTPHPDEREALLAVQGLLDRLHALIEAYEETSRKWRTLATEVHADGDDGRVQAVQAELVKRQKELQTAVKQLNVVLDDRIRRVNERVTRAQARATTVGGGLAAVALALGLAMLAWTLLTLRPISRLTTQVQRVAAGDYSGRIALRRDDEIGVLAREFDTMAQSLAERDRRLVERAEELNRLSRYLRSVLDTIHLGLVVEEEGRVTVVNPAARRMWNVVEEEPLPPLLDELDEGRWTGIAVKRRRYDIEVAPFGQGGRLLVGEDVTQALLDRERLEHSERLALIGKMLAQICHEVRNPLNAMSLNADLLSEEMSLLDPEGETEGKELLHVIVQEILRLDGVTEHYLDMVRRPAPQCAPHSIVELVRSVAALEEAEFHRRGVSLSLSLPEGEIQADVDENQIRRALVNVLHNARNSGAKKVVLGVRASEDQVSVHVRDDGPGMDAHTLERAFDPFFTTRSKGTGLGLAITRRIVDDHGGRVHCRSSHGEGCEMVIRLPLRQQDSPARPSITAGPPDDP